MYPFRKAFSGPASAASRRGLRTSPTLGYELVDFNQQPINLYGTELTYCEPHWHEAAELIYVLGGCFDVRIGNRSTLLREGGLLFVGADDVHTVHTQAPGSALLAVQFSPALDKVSGRRPGDGPSVLVEARLIDDAQYERFAAALADLARHVLHHEPAFGDYGLLRRVFALLETLTGLASTAGPAEPGVAGGGNDRQMEIAKRAIAYTNDHFLDDIKLLDVADAMGVSYHHLSHTFKGVTGFNFREYLTLLRVNKARELLRDENLNITKIASSSGFSEHKHLDAAFKKYFATTPTQYRKKYLNQLLVSHDHPSDGINRLLTPAQIEGWLGRGASR